MTTETTETFEPKYVPRPRRTLFGTALRTVFAGLAASALTVLAAVVYDRESHTRQTSVQPPRFAAAARSSASAESTAKPSAGPPVAAPEIDPPSPSDAPPAAANYERLDAPNPAPAPQLAQLLDKLEDSIVKIESGEEGDLSGLGSGFVIDAHGLVVTNYHVVADATRARVRFKNGAAYDVAGYAAVDPNLDLALLRLVDRPPHLEPLQLAAEGDPARLSPIVAVGHPQGVEFSPFDGKVSRVLTTSQLPPGSQRFLRQLISGQRNHRWVQHTAAISEGNSGGPLLNEQGQVVGVNTWVDRQARFGYALHAQHVRDLLEEASSDAEPLRKYARKDARVADLLERLTPERLEQLVIAAERMKWRPESESDYETLQQIAWAVTVVNLPDTLARGRIDDRLDALGRVTDRIVRRLSRQQWDAVGQVTLINDYALEQISRPMAGVFLFGVVERTVEGDAGERGALVKVAGSQQMLFLPLDGELTVPEPGLQCLILGVNYDGHRVRYGDNPLKLVTAHVIATRTLLPIVGDSRGSLRDPALDRGAVRDYGYVRK